jgi:hypothetical protein
VTKFLGHFSPARAADDEIISRAAKPDKTELFKAHNMTHSFLERET